MVRRDQIAHAQHVALSVRNAAALATDEADQRLLRSWQRSLESYRLDPGRAAAPRILTASGLRDHQEPLENFLRIARLGVAALHEQVRDASYVVLLTDAAGVTIDFMGSPSLDRELRRAGLYLGSCWTEPEEGTCGVGTAIVDRAAITVHKTEHFRAPNITLTCSAAPIFGVDGELLAVLDGSALYSPNERKSQALVFQLVCHHARLVEDAHFLETMKAAWVLRLARSPEFLDVRTDCLIACDEGGRVLAANGRARREFFGGAKPAGGPLEDLFEAGLGELIRAGAGRSEQTFPLQRRGNGATFHARLRVPDTQPPRAIAARSPAAPGQAGAAFAHLDLGDAAMRANIARACRIAGRRLPVLLLGETGTGKEAFARALHRAGSRRDKVFVAVNCAAIPESLIESELFGYRDGAFTGARARGMKGKVVQATGGTLFLDEIGDMPYDLQSRLLRVLAEQEVVPLGADEAVPVDLSVICATHRDLAEMVQSGAFRDDLFYRLNGAVFRLPPLRERADIDALIARLMDEEARHAGGACRIDGAALDALKAYPWPGNIRELRNALTYACAVCEDGVVRVGDLPGQILAGPARAGAAATLAGPAPDGAAPGLLAALRRHRWRIAACARELGVSRATLYRRMAREGIVAPNRLGP